MAVMAQEAANTLCSRCKDRPTTLIARNEAMCADCFVRYVSTKVVKRLESFNRRHIVPGQHKRLLVPSSFGASSIAMLHLLSRQIEWQITRSRRASYELHILHVYDDRLADARDHAQHQLDLVQAQYSGQAFGLCPLSDIFASSAEPKTDRLTRLMTQIKDTTSRADVEQILLRRVIVEYAQQKSLDGIFWGESTTKLAEKVLSESSKGRGYALPWSVSDGETPFGLLYCFPMRDVLKKEIVQFVKLGDPFLAGAVTVDTTVPSMPVSSKSMTIDILSRQYFESVEANYPSIVSNVVRTSSKLEATVLSLRRCKLCQFPVTPEQLEHNDWQGLQRQTSVSGAMLHSLCYGCSRTIPEEAISLLP